VSTRRKRAGRKCAGLVYKRGVVGAKRPSCKTRVGKEIGELVGKLKMQFKKATASPKEDEAMVGRDESLAEQA